MNELVKWRDTKTFDEILKKDLQKKDKKLDTFFSSNLQFDSMGIHGVMGAGTNRINEFTVAQVAQAYSLYLLKNVKNVKTKGIVLAHDDRHNSKLFSEVATRVLMANGIKVYLWTNNDSQPMPLVSYAIKKMMVSGGLVITASNYSKDNNGFKFYNNLGGQLNSSEIQKIEDNLIAIDPLNVSRSNKEFSFLGNDIIDLYESDVLEKIQIGNDKKTIKVAFSPLHGSSSKIVPKIMDKFGYENYVVKNQMNSDSDFSNAKSINPEDGQAYNKVITLAKKKKADVAFVVDPNAEGIGLVVKHQRRYKYLNGNQAAALYLDYKLNRLKSMNKTFKNGYIVSTPTSGDLAKKIAAKHGIRVVTARVGFENLSEVIKEEEGTFVFAYEESYGMLLDSSFVNVKDSFQTTIGLLEMANYFKNEGINAYEHLKKLFSEYGIHRTITQTKVFDDNMANRLLKRVSKIKTVNNCKVDYIENYNSKNEGLIKVVLKNGSWFAIEKIKNESKVKIYVQSIGTKKQELIDVVIFEKQVFNFIDDNTEVFDDKHWSWKSFFKYSIFLMIIIGIMAFVFLKIYAQGNSSGNIWSDAKTIIDRQSRWIWLSMFLFIAFTTFLNALIRKRLIDLGGQKVKIRHLIISGLMGSVISYITPFAIGGDAIGYWYLRKKGFKRGPLLSSFISSTIIYQFGLILQSLILVPIGIPLYKEILFNDSVQSHTSLILFIIGISWNIFATIMIFSLTIGKRFQEFIVRNSIKLLEWAPFIMIQDSGSLSSSYQYEFMEMRNGMKKIWKKKALISEVILYELILMFLNSGAILLILSNVISPNLFAGKYWTQIVASDMSTTANSLSITPGGSGTGEWLSININKFIYKPGSDLGIEGGASHTASAVDLIWKMISSWPMLVVSSLMILTIIIGEGRNSKYEKINKNNDLNDKKTNYNTRFYKLISVPWGLLFLTYVLVFVYAI